MNSNAYSKFLSRLTEEIRTRFENHPGCHDWDHTRRVLANARVLAEGEAADQRICETAALLHDVGRLQELEDEGVTCHARLGAEIAPELMRQAGMTDEAFIEQVRHCVESHRYRRRETTPEPHTLEAKIVYDADKLDSLGAIGVGRAFHFAGRIGARVHNSTAEARASQSYSRNDTAYREYLVKQQHLHENMLTKTGQTLGQRRHKFMVEFFRELNQECPDTIAISGIHK